jgi:hypothetical protein
VAGTALADLLQTKPGDDLVDGGGGLDTAVYTGQAKDYAWWSNPDGTWTVQDLRSGAPDGVDTLKSIEQLQFASGFVKTEGLTPTESVNSAFGNILRGASGPGDAALLQATTTMVASGQLTVDQAVLQAVKQAGASTSVATLAYQFFTGAIPSKGGIDYLVSTTSDNPNNLNSAYYQSFNLENRYINFAVNLGKLGEGKDAFAAAYGQMTFEQATRTAYTTIFGTTPSDAKIHALIDSRMDYFAYYGQDGASGIGAKAAMVGWLLAEAVKADVGVYAKANDAFLADLADGARYAVDLVGTYGKAEFAFGA